MDGSGDLQQQISGVASLHDRVRRDLYLYVVGQGHDVSRDEAAAAVGISRSLTAFHLDKLATEGLLGVTYRRLSGRTGPGAGRPSKLYYRSGRQLQVTLPPRSYELAARLFASAIDTSSSPDALDSLQRVARDFGAEVGTETQGSPLDALMAGGYEPFLDERGDIRLRNCPFHALAESHRALVCGMNLSLMNGLVEGLGNSGLHAVLEPQPGMCCVALKGVSAEL